MQFCPDCGTKMSEDTQFCPECGRPLAIEQATKGKSKWKIAEIVVGCIIAVIVIVVVATRPPATVEPEPAIPAHFTTYTDEIGLFSISYPPEWELDFETIEETEQLIKDIIRSISSDLPVEDVSLIFLAGVPTERGLFPSVNIIVEPCPLIVCTHDAVVRAEVEGGKEIWPDYHDFSRIKTTIDNRTATIIEYQNTIGSVT